jgi:NTE family protein
VSTAFVLSGGGSLGAVQVGMLLTLADRGVTPDVVVGTSVGALNAAYIAGHRWPEAAADLAGIWSSLRREDVFPITLAGVCAAVTRRRNHLVSDRGLRALLHRHLGYERLEDAPVPALLVATEVTTGREVVLREGPAAQAIMASASLPGIFPTVSIGGQALIDGGLVDNTPISVAVDLGVDTIFVLPTGYACALAGPPASALGMALHAVTLAIQRRLIEDVAALQQTNDLRVAPTLCPLAVSPADFRQAA